MTDERARYAGLIDTFFHAVEDKRLDDVRACFNDDATFHAPFAAEPMPVDEWVRDFLSAFVARFASISEYASHVIVDGDRGISELVLDGILLDGNPVHFENCNLYRFRDGKFQFVRVYADAGDMRRQLGIVEEPVGTGAAGT